MNRVLAHTGARYPIVQAPMGWIARRQLATAVSRAGGFKNPEEVSTLVLLQAIRARVDVLMPMDALKGIQRLYFEGDMEAAPALAGQSAGLIDGVKTEQQIIDDTVAEFFAISARLGGLAMGRAFA